MYHDDETMLGDEKVQIEASTESRGSAEPLRNDFGVLRKPYHYRRDVEFVQSGGEQQNQPFH